MSPKSFRTKRFNSPKTVYFFKKPVRSVPILATAVRNFYLHRGSFFEPFGFLLSSKLFRRGNVT
jgi:hypothetical protein